MHSRTIFSDAMTELMHTSGNVLVECMKLMLRTCSYIAPNRSKFLQMSAWIQIAVPPPNRAEVPVYGYRMCDAVENVP